MKGVKAFGIHLAAGTAALAHGGPLPDLPKKSVARLPAKQKVKVQLDMHKAVWREEGIVMPRADKMAIPMPKQKGNRLGMAFSRDKQVKIAGVAHPWLGISVAQDSTL